MAALPADELSGPGEEVAVVAHQVVRHHHGVDVIAGNLVGGKQNQPLQNLGTQAAAAFQPFRSEPG